MDIERLGRLFPYRLSFMRILVRRLMQEKWRIQRVRFDLDDEGYGVSIYEIQAPENLFSFVVFSSFLDPSRRSDRVIAEEWDMTVTLCEGRVDEHRLERFRQNVPLQENGRLDSGCLVLSRANKSARTFEHVVSALAEGKQPSVATMAKVGYLYRTTAVYGSGKFGMADWEKVRTKYRDFGRPFSAEMFSCYMIRQYSLDQAEFLARKRSPDKAVPMQDTLKRYIGIGNATGLGMAPYLINHPMLISRWIEIRETALAKALQHGEFSPQALIRFASLVKKAMRHLSEIATENKDQNAINEATRVEAGEFLQWLEAGLETLQSWQDVVAHYNDSCSVETQELLNTLLIEIYPEHVNDLEEDMCVAECYEHSPEMSATELRDLIQTNYDWALEVDFTAEQTRAVFWYRSEEKMEPRIGSRGIDTGADRELNVGIAWSVRRCYDALAEMLDRDDEISVGEFLFECPQHRQVVRRLQTLAKFHYGDIRTNFLDVDVMPIHLLRCKLSFFGVSKFDPRSRFWVRNTMFQGAPLVSDIGQEFLDDWCFPVIPDEKFDA